MGENLKISTFFTDSPPHKKISKYFSGPPYPLPPSEVDYNLSLFFIKKNAKTQPFCLIKCIIYA